MRQRYIPCTNTKTVTKMEKQNNRENTLAAIELVVKEFLTEEAIGHWYSVSERSLSNIMEQVNLDKHYSKAIYDGLAEIGLIERQGSRAQLRYKINSCLIPDSRALAEKIYKNRNNEVTSKKREWYETRPGDLTPPRQRKRVTIGEFENKKKRETLIKNGYNQIPRLGEIVYVVIRGSITQARITCVRFDENDKVLVDFITAIKESEVQSPIKQSNWCLKNIFFSVEDLIKKLQENIYKFEEKK